MTLSIPALAIAATATTGTLPYTTPAHMQEADRILQTSVYKYRDAEVYGAHDYGIFQRLPEIREGFRVQINGEPFEVARTFTIDATDTWLLRRRGTFLMTCTDNNRKRFIVLLQRQE